MPKIKLPENIKKLKDQLDAGHNLVDHFLICGLPPSICMDESLYDITNKEYPDKFPQLNKPCIISRFPEFDISIDSIDEEIINYCFPEGFKIQKSPNKTKKFFSVILDNNLSSSEHPQKYLTCLIFYEKISEYHKLKLYIEGKETNINLEKRESTISNFNLDKRKSDSNIIINSNRESIQSIATLNSINNETFIDEKSSENTSSIMRVSTLDIRKNRQSVEDSMKEQFQRKNVTTEKDIFYVPKCICLVSIYPYIKLHQIILEEIYKYINYPREIPLEKIITNLIIEVPIPPRGLYRIDYTLIDNELSLVNYENNKIQLAEINLQKFNKNIDFQTKLEALKHILFGSKLLFFSTNVNNLCETILAFLYLLYPFKYPFQVSSYLHKDNYNILESISPFILGINERYSDDFFEQNEISTEGMNVYIIDLDKKENKLFTDEEFPKFPTKLSSALEKDIKNLETKYKGKDFQENILNSNLIFNANKQNIIKEFNEAYQNLFLGFFVEILRGYEECLNMDYFKTSDTDKVTSIDTLFKCTKFIKSHNNNEIEFYTKFIGESQLFADFIYKRMIPRNNQEIIDVLLVNETITKSKNKGKFFFASDERTDFLNSNEYNPSNKYVVPKPRELTVEEIELLEEQKDTLQNLGQIITPLKKNNNNNSDKNNKNQLIFTYFIFPQLDFQLYCNNNNVNAYYIPPDYSEDIEAKNTDLISKSSIGQNINHTLEMKNYLYLTWLEIWAYTFWYVDKDERKYRFDQMLDVLDKVIHHEMNIFNLLFDVLNNQNEQKMIVKLYQKVLQIKINPSTFIYNIISNRLDKEEIKELFDEMKTGGCKSLKFGGHDVSKFKQRTLLSKSDKNSLINSELIFDSYFLCVDCQEKINLYKFCQTFEGFKNDILWLPCVQCKNYNLPKIKVQFGLELFPNHNKKIDDNSSTSVYHEIVLHSPYNLKINIKDAVTTQYGMKLDVNNFKAAFSALFWDFIWYCNIHNLDYSIIEPYLSDFEQSKITKGNNPNNNFLKLIYDNKLYKKNEDKIEDAIKNGNILSMTLYNKSKSIIIPFRNLEPKQIYSFEIRKIKKYKFKKSSTIFIDHKLTEKPLRTVSEDFSKTKKHPKLENKHVNQTSRNSVLNEIDENLIDRCDEVDEKDVIKEEEEEKEVDKSNIKNNNNNTMLKSVKTTTENKNSSGFLDKVRGIFK